ncbi:MAG: ribosomal protein S18 acetylase RimI-like enzyme [Cryomorphaceae bacterium]|jgi:ribosomal protein S18 acetylase RimI-like enzyme
MEISDYENVIALWQETEGVRLRCTDSREGVEKCLKRNLGLSFVACLVAEKGDQIVGTIMSGHDGRRCNIQHLAISSDWRQTGIATALLSRCIQGLKREGIFRSQIYVLSENVLAKKCWSSRGCEKRTDIKVYSSVNEE